MADFEGLIRQALARQDDTDPDVRERIYQSSRNALAKMIASAGPQPLDVVEKHRQTLEMSINRIESGYAPLQPEPVEEVSDEPQFDHREQPGAHGGGDEDWSVDEAGDPGVDIPETVSMDDGYSDRPDDDYYDDNPDDFSVNPEDSGILRRRESSSRRLFLVGAILVALLALAWVGNTLYSAISGNLAARNTPQAQQAEQAASDQVEDAVYIVLLSPTDTGALVTAGNGSAEIVNQSNIEMIRLTSLRQQSDKETPANPIRLEIQPGVVERIAGRKVTVEILAKSGTSGPATFAVGCQFSDEDICGRKRFRVGLQPEAIVFTLDVKQQAGADSPAYFSLSTDITSSAALTGAGDSIDILYARLRL
ncbi:MAG: hypothetical protein WBO55_17655 [Rhizobiaceae bacterium]